MINELADSGVGVIILSSEFKEVRGICDRILVLRKGSVVNELTAEEASTEKILTMALGG